MPKATDKTFIEKLDSLWRSKSSHYEPIRLDQGFKLQHYAGRVTYSTLGWLDKNKDPLNENITKLLAQSSDSFIASLFSDYLVEDNDISLRTSVKSKTKKGLFRTVAQRHKEQLTSLMTLLYSTQPHFVRCIVPNSEKKMAKFHAGLIVDQLRCNGVLEGIRICRQGYPNRIYYAEFKQRYEVLATDVVPKGFMDGKHVCNLILAAIDLDQSLYRLGNSKVFFKAGVVCCLTRERHHSNTINLLASRIRGASRC
jgi:myosin heavy subunit